jgi:hypothetical protein
MGAVKPAEFDERYAAAVPSSWEESVVSGAIANRFAISRPLLNLKGDQTTIDQTSVIPQAGRHRMQARSLQLESFKAVWLIPSS